MKRFGDTMSREEIVTKIKDMMLKGQIAPWKAESEALKEGIPALENITTGVFVLSSIFL